VSPRAKDSMHTHTLKGFRMSSVKIIVFRYRNSNENFIRIILTEIQILMRTKYESWVQRNSQEYLEELDPVLLDSSVKYVIDGVHRLKENPNWRTEKLENLKNRKTDFSGTNPREPV